MRAGIAIGSDLGDRMGNLRAARQFLETFGPLVVAPVYETLPVDCPPGTPAFLNTVVEIETEVEPREMLRRLLHFEATHGRPNVHGRNQPRTVDLDLLYYGNLIVRDAELTLPHSRLHTRRFVLQPLADIRPELVLPGFDRSVVELLASLGEAQPVRLAAKDW